MPPLKECLKLHTRVVAVCVCVGGPKRHFTLFQAFLGLVMCTCGGAMGPQSYVYTAALSGVLGTGSLGEGKGSVLLTRQSYLETKLPYCHRHRHGSV